MSSTFLGLNTAYSGLQASNNALNTTANNIANVDTEGYSRQVVTTKAANSIRSYTTYGCVGAGVETVSIARVRDSFYDEKYWDNNSKLGEYGIKSYYMQTIENYYIDDDSVKGFSSIFDEFSNSISELAKNPDDDATKMQMIGYAQNLTTYFTDMATNLEKLQSDMNQEVKVNTDRINSIAQEIASLNKQINVIEMNTGATANELRDQRDVLIDELTEIVSVDVEEQPIIDTADTSRDTGGTRYIVSICGQTLVDGNEYKTLTCVPRDTDEKTNLSDIDGLYDIYFSGDSNWTSADYRSKGDSLNIAAKNVSGKLAGLIQMRDGNNGENFSGKVSSVDESAQKVTIDVTADYLVDLNKVNLPVGGGIITIGNTNYYYSSWTYEYDEGTGTCSYTFDLDRERNGKNVITQGAATKQVDAEVGTSIAYQGIPYYQSQMNEWVRMYANAFNSILEEGVTDSGKQGTGLFIGTNTITGEELDFGTSFALTGNSSNVISVSSDPNAANGNTYYQLTAGNFGISETLLKYPAELATRSDQYSGVEDNDIVERLANIRSDKSVMTFRSCAADQFLVCIMSDVAMNSQRAQKFESNYTTLQSTIENQRLSISGVDNDEEAINLTKYQQQYNLAAKMIQVLTEVYDRLILETGV